ALGAAAAVPAGYLAWPRAAAKAQHRFRMLDADAPPHVLQIVAHQDDDLLFLNPDVDLIKQGIATTTVYLTAGEANGAVDGSLTRTQFAAGRQAGSRAAYAALMGVADQWQREVYTSSTGQHAELATLVGTPGVRLIFLSLPDSGDTAYGAQGQALPGLLLDRFPTIPTLVPDSGPVTSVSEYSKDALVQTLTELMEQFQPSLIRTLDPQYAEQSWRGARNSGGDNLDHEAAARVTDLALRGYLGIGTGTGTGTATKPGTAAGKSSGPGSGSSTGSPGSAGSTGPKPITAASPGLAVVNYVGYGIASLPSNLDDAVLATKTSVFSTYTTQDRNVQIFRKNYNVYLPSQRYRWAPPSPVLLPDGPGATSAFAILNRQVIRWYRAAPEWGGPEALGPGGDDGVVAMAAISQPDGRIRLFALVIDVTTNTGEITTTVQGQPGGEFEPWQSLGAPGPDAGTKTDEPWREAFPGPPFAAVTSANTVQVGTQASDGFLYARTLDKDAWQPWTQVGQADLVDVPSAIATKDRGAEMFAATMVSPDGPAGTAPAVCQLVRWPQVTSGGPLVADPQLPNVQVVSAPVAVRDTAGIAVFCQTPGAGVTMLRSQTKGVWSTATGLGGADFVATPTAHLKDPAAGGTLILAGRGFDGSVSILEEAPDKSFAPSWTRIGGNAIGSAGIASDSTGRTDVAVIDVHGRLSVATRPGPDQPFQPWQTAGP
ncbi:PIG-L family deacetylase, partial [Catenulispora sp. NL8]